MGFRLYFFKLVALLFFVFCNYVSNAQLLNSDCDEATVLDIYNNPVYSPNEAPSGYGKALEIKGNRLYNPYYFEKEHNTAWYFIPIKYHGELALDIIPDNASDDYDFLLYKFDSIGSCDEILKKKILPVRSNLARNKMEDGGKTGLSNNSLNEFVTAGVGDNYSKSLLVFPNESYYLVVDNVYNYTGNHTIKFTYQHVSQVVFKVVNVNSNLGLNAELEFKNLNKEQKYLIDAVNGLVIQMNELPSDINDIMFFSPGYEYETISIIKENLLSNFSDTILVKLKPLEVGKSFVLKNLNFHGNKATLLPGASNSLKELLLLMEKNASVTIRIDGHVNGCIANFDINKLSLDRADAIKSYLVKNGISASRIETKGFGCKKMLYPNPTDEWEQGQNRRVEVTISSF